MLQLEFQDTHIYISTVGMSLFPTYWLEKLFLPQVVQREINRVERMSSTDNTYTGQKPSVAKNKVSSSMVRQILERFDANGGII